MSTMSERQRPIRESTFNGERAAPDGVPYRDITPIITHESVKGSHGIMALDLTGGVVRVITKREFNRYVEKDGELHGSYEHGFVDFSDLHYVFHEIDDDGERWVVGERVAIKGLSRFVEEMQNQLSHLSPIDDVMTVKAHHLGPNAAVTIDSSTDTIQLHVPSETLAAEEVITTTPADNATIEITREGIALLLATELGENMFLGPEDPTVVRLADGTIRAFITLAVKKLDGGYTYVTLMLKGTSMHDLEAVGIVPVGTVKEMCFGPVYNTADGDREVMLGEGSFMGYSTVRAEIVGADFELGSFTNTGLVSMLPSNIHDRFARYYKGTTETPEVERYNWVKRHISPNKVLDHDILPLFDGWHVVMTSGRSPGEETDSGATMGPFEVGVMVTQLDPSHKYAGQTMWIDDRPLFRLNGAESITFGSDWYIKPDGKTGMNRTIVFIVHRDDKDICAVEMPLSAVWERLPEFLREGDEAAIAEAADTVIQPHIDLPIEKRSASAF